MRRTWAGWAALLLLGTTLIAYFVIPRFEALWADRGVRLGLVPRLVIRTSHFFIERGLFVLLLIAGLFAWDYHFSRKPHSPARPD